MKTSKVGRQAITRREGLRRKAYQDSVGVWTICVGHTSAAGAPRVTPGMQCTLAECDAILSRDLAKFEAAVNRAIAKPMTQNQFDAMVSLAFNIGPGAFARSSVATRFNRGDVQGAADAFMFWRNAGGRPILEDRRRDERAQFRRPGEPPAEPPGDDVLEMVQETRKLQAGLKAWLMTDLVGPIDGDFGPKTEATVRAFQAYNGLDVDGIPGPKTTGALFPDEKP